MDLGQIPVFAAIQERMRFLGARQRVVSENIANADTPGYQARTVAAPDFSEILGSQAGSMKVPVPRVRYSHNMVRFDPELDRADLLKSKAVSQDSKPNRNSVVLEDQLMTLADTQMDYAAMSNLYRKQINMLRTALGRNR